jgi:Protein of unknown function (DUF3168)
MTFTDPGVALQRAIVQALLADSAVAALVAKGVYDTVPRDSDGSPSAPFPYVTFGETQTIPELSECTDAAETFVTLHTWSRKVGFGEVKALSAAVITALHDQPLTLASGAIQSLLMQDSRTLRDPDGITSHGVITFQILTDAN